MLTELRGFMAMIRSPTELYQTRKNKVINTKRTLLVLFKV